MVSHSIGKPLRTPSNAALFWYISQVVTTPTTDPSSTPSTAMNPGCDGAAASTRTYYAGSGDRSPVRPPERQFVSRLRGAVAAALAALGCIPGSTQRLRRGPRRGGGAL